MYGYLQQRRGEFEEQDNKRQSFPQQPFCFYTRAGCYDHREKVSHTLLRSLLIPDLCDIFFYYPLSHNLTLLASSVNYQPRLVFYAKVIRNILLIFV